MTKYYRSTVSRLAIAAFAAGVLALGAQPAAAWDHTHGGGGYHGGYGGYHGGYGGGYGYRGGYGWHGGWGGGWAGPAIVGGTLLGLGLAGAFAPPPPVYYAPPPAYYAPPPTYYAPPPGYYAPPPGYNAAPGYSPGY